MEGCNISQWVASTEVMSVLRGQFISIFVAGTGVFATFLSSTDPTSNFPTFMNLLNYLLLSSYVLRMNFSINRKPWTAIKQSDRNVCLLYFLGAVLDLEANFLVLEAYNYTSITSVMLLDCFTIPCAMVMSHYFLQYRYTWRHLLGCLICLLGLGLMVYTDSLTSEGESGQIPNAVLGDILCLCGAVLYASSNVLQEYLVKKHGREQYMGFLGVFGLMLAFVQCMIVDYPKMRKARFTLAVGLYICGFVGCLFTMYINTSSFLQTADAALFNLSLLTSDVYAVIFSYFLNGRLVHWLYFIAFGFVATGLAAYHREVAPSRLGAGDVSSALTSSKAVEDPEDNVMVGDVASPFHTTTFGKCDVTDCSARSSYNAIPVTDSES